MPTVLLQASGVITTNAQYYHGGQKDRDVQQNHIEHASDQKTDIVTDQGRPEVRQPGTNLLSRGTAGQQC